MMFFRGFFYFRLLRVLFVVLLIAVTSGAMSKLM
jgi:hypothetical protein